MAAVLQNVLNLSLGDSWEAAIYSLAAEKHGVCRLGEHSTRVLSVLTVSNGERHEKGRHGKARTEMTRPGKEWGRDSPWGSFTEAPKQNPLCLPLLFFSFLCPSLSSTPLSVPCHRQSWQSIFLNNYDLFFLAIGTMGASEAWRIYYLIFKQQKLDHSGQLIICFQKPRVSDKLIFVQRTLKVQQLGSCWTEAQTDNNDERFRLIM